MLISDIEPGKSRWNREIRTTPNQNGLESMTDSPNAGTPLSSFSFRVFGVVRGLNCRFQDEFCDCNET